MTLIDISRLLKLAGVPRSKVIQWGYPKPGIIIHVDASHILIMCEVVKQMALATDNIQVTQLTSHEIVAGEHAYVKIKGDVIPPTFFDDVPAEERRRIRMKSARQSNRPVVVEFHSVIT